MTRSVNRNRVADYSSAEPEARLCLGCNRVMPVGVRHDEIKGFPGCTAWIMTYETINDVPASTQEDFPVLRVHVIGRVFPDGTSITPSPISGARAIE